jgi:hypothetical protein
MADCMITGMISSPINQSLGRFLMCLDSLNDTTVDHTSHSDQHNTYTKYEYHNKKVSTD